MVDIEYLERKKTELIADHVRRCGATPLDEAEKFIIAELNYQIKMLKELPEKGRKNGRKGALDYIRHFNDDCGNRLHSTVCMSADCDEIKKKGGKK